MRGMLGAVVATTVLASPVLAHGDHDARPIARALPAGPYSISLWQVYPDMGDAMTPHLIVLFDGVAASPAGAAVSVAVNAMPMDVVRSSTTANGWETTMGVGVHDVVMVTITQGGESWGLDPVVVPPPTTSVLPMRELIYGSIVLTAVAALWALARTARAWRRPAPRPG